MNMGVHRKYSMLGLTATIILITNTMQQIKAGNILDPFEKNKYGVVDIGVGTAPTLNDTQDAESTDLTDQQSISLNKSIAPETISTITKEPAVPLLPASNTLEQMKPLQVSDQQALQQIIPNKKPKVVPAKRIVPATADLAQPASPNSNPVYDFPSSIDFKPKTEPKSVKEFGAQEDKNSLSFSMSDDTKQPLSDIDTTPATDYSDTSHLSQPNSSNTDIEAMKVDLLPEDSVTPPIMDIVATPSVSLPTIAAPNNKPSSNDQTDLKDQKTNLPADQKNSDTYVEPEQSPLPESPSLAQPIQGSTTKITEPEEELVIDTLEQEEPQGNWLFKRVWWQYSEGSYEKLRKLVDEVQDIRMKLLAIRREIEHEILDPFYLTIGIGQGELQALITDLLSNKAYMKNSSSNQISVEQRDLSDNIEQDRVQLEQLQRDVNAIVVLEASLDQAVDMLAQQIKLVRQYEQEAWQYFKDVSRVLNDKKAQELFYKIKSSSENIRAILDYLKEGFSMSFNELTQKITQQVDRVKASLQALKEKGVILKGKAQQVEEAERAKRQNECDIKQEKEEEQAQPKESSWVRTITRPFAWAGNSIISAVRVPYDVYQYFFGGTKDELEEQQAATE